MRHGRRDGRHAEIRDGIRARGISVEDTADLGDGFPDIVCGRGGTTYMFEVKSDAGKESPGQAKKRQLWRGGPWNVIKTLDEALVIMGVPR
jgi:Holliday junction resolvase